MTMDETGRMLVVNSPPESDKRWLVIIVPALLVFLAWGFLYMFCEPTPSFSQTLIFFTLLVLILIETIAAGFAKRRDT